MNTEWVNRQKVFQMERATFQLAELSVPVLLITKNLFPFLIDRHLIKNFLTYSIAYSSQSDERNRL